MHWLPNLWRSYLESWISKFQTQPELSATVQRLPIFSLTLAHVGLFAYFHYLSISSWFYRKLQWMKKSEDDSIKVRFTRRMLVNLLDHDIKRSEKQTCSATSFLYWKILSLAFFFTPNDVIQSICCLDDWIDTEKFEAKENNRTACDFQWTRNRENCFEIEIDKLFILWICLPVYLLGVFFDFFSLSSSSNDSVCIKNLVTRRWKRRKGSKQLELVASVN